MTVPTREQVVEWSEQVNLVYRRDGYDYCDVTPVTLRAFANLARADLEATIAEQVVEIERLKQYEGYVEACSEMIEGGGLLAIKIKRLKDKFAAAQNSDQHNFDRWQVAQADNEQLLKVLGELVSIVNIHSNETLNDFAWAEMEEAEAAIAKLQSEKETTREVFCQAIDHAISLNLEGAYGEAEEQSRMIIEQAAEIERLGKYPPANLTWLYSHCRAIGMYCEANSGKWEEDIALFTIHQKSEIERLNVISNNYSTISADRFQELTAEKAKVKLLTEVLELLPTVLIAEQPEWDMSENNGTIWGLFLERYCNEAITACKARKGELK